MLATAAFEMLFGGFVLLAAGLARGEGAWLAFTPGPVRRWLYLIVVGAIGGFSAYAYALKHLPVATVSLYAYVNPVIAVVLGTLILKEPFNARTGDRRGDRARGDGARAGERETAEFRLQIAD